VWGGLDGVDSDVQVRLQCQSGGIQEHVALRVSKRELIQKPQQLFSSSLQGVICNEGLTNFVPAIGEL
jgi:hypothetical protein